MDNGRQQVNGRVKKTSTTAGIIVVGNEILKGRLQDSNTHYLCHQLWLCGVKVCKVVVVSDDRDEIAGEVQRFAAAYDHVLTTGGVGPTHDDVTIEAVGMAFGEESTVHPDVLDFLLGEDDEEDDNLVRKMALVPKSTEVYVQEPSCMLICIHNVHCYPGTPSLVKDIFQANKGLYCNKGSSVQFNMRELFLGCCEDLIAKPLSLVQSEYPAVQMGSYPSTNIKASHCVKITFEADDTHLLDKAYTRLALLLPKDMMMSSLDHHSSPESHDPRKELGWLLAHLSPGVASLLPPSLYIKLRHTLATFDETYHRYSFDEVCVAFNGGKDCTAMLDLLHSYLTKKGHDFSQHRLNVLYVTHSAQFPEVEEFVEEAISRYSLDPIRISGLGIREALCQLKHSHPRFRAIMMGTRRTDPFSSELSEFSPTDSSWPDYMRINCLLDWGYMEVWMFLRTMAIPYCPLYDRGYSSLDGVNDTHLNSHLAVDTNATVLTGWPHTAGGYMPAYMLANELHERAGRSRK